MGSLHGQSLQAAYIAAHKDVGNCCSGWFLELTELLVVRQGDGAKPALPG
jgi:hypothetical protein